MITQLFLVSVMAALIGFRAARAIAVDDVGMPIRAWAKGNPDSAVMRQTARLVSCPHCVGFWITLVVGVVVSTILLDENWTVHAIVALAATGLQSLMTSYAVDRH